VAIHRIDAMEATFDMASSKTYNMIVLGALLGLCPVIPDDSVDRALEKVIPERHHDLLEVNRLAFRRGLELAEK